MPGRRVLVLRPQERSRRAYGVVFVEEPMALMSLPSLVRAGYATLNQLVRDGVVCHGPDEEEKSTFVHRYLWLTDLDWAIPDDESAYAELTRRCFTAYGPAAPSDLAYWFGTTVTTAKRWGRHRRHRRSPVCGVYGGV